MLVGRHRELQTIEALAAGARVGRSGVLVIVGEAGCGKTALVTHVSGNLRDMQVCRVVGTEAERELGFGGLSQLIGPHTDDLSQLPDPQAHALGVALNLRTGSGAERLPVGAGTLGVLTYRAERAPLALVIDDAHLLDDSSAQALTFAARRLVADPILVLATVRTGEDSPLLHADLPVLELGGLDAEGTRELLAGHTGRPVTATQAGHLARVTRGNPLALLELGSDVDALETIGPVDALSLSEALTRAFVARAEQLSPPARSALVVAACSGGDVLVVQDACRRLGLDPEVLAEAVDARLVVGVESMQFRHPLVRAALVSAADPAFVRTVHAALADATSDTDPDRFAWHRASAVPGPDADVATALVGVAARATARGAHDVAATALERAGRLSTSTQDRAARLVESAESAWLAGLGSRAVELLEQAAPATSDLVARSGHLHGRIAARTGSVAEAMAVFRQTALQVETDAPDSAVELWADGVNAAFFRGDVGYLRTALVAIARSRARVSTQRAQILAELAAGMATTLVGGDGADRIRRSVARLSDAPALRADPLRAEWLVLGPLYLREEVRFRALVQQGLSDIRETGALGELAHLLLLVALDDAASDRWSQADAEYQESIRLARELGHTTDLALALAGLSWLEARIGRDRDCRDHAAEAVRLCEQKDIVIGRVWAGLGLGELELGAGRAEESLAHLDRAGDLLERSGVHDLDLHPGSDRVEALVRLGRVDEARELARSYHLLASAKGQAWALARAERVLGLVAEDPAEAEAHLATAAALHEETPDRFEAARTNLVRGAALRRHRRRREARVVLREALAVFEALGAEQRAEQTARELAATGERVQRRGASLLTTLTAQERQIAQLLGEGRTTRQVAAALFLSPKTVEYHLRHVYTKLGVRSRAELAQAMGASS